MALFLAIYLVYGTINFYIFWRIRQAFPLGRWQWAVAGCLLLLFVGPFIVRAVERMGLTRFASGVGVVLFSWLAISFWFFCVGVAIDLWNIVVWLLAQKWQVLLAGFAGPRMQLAIVAGFVVVALALSLRESQAVGLTQIEIAAPQLPAGSKPIRIVQLSDVHLGGGTSGYRLDKILDLIRQVQPDILISTGDLIDAPLESIGHYAEMLKAIEPPSGKFAIPGNHEYYVGIDASRKFHEAAGFVWLRNKTADVGHLHIAGCDDEPRAFFRPDGQSDLPLLTADRMEFFTLLLKHKPFVQDPAVGKFDLQLSGHTHGGQIFPFNFVIATIFRYDRGMFDLGDGSRIFVDRGAGTWGPPMRLFSPPEVVVFTLRPTQ